MKIVVTTPTGNIGRRVSHLLVQAGVRPTLIARNPDRVDAELRDLADVQTGDLNDAARVREITRGADALFWLNPPSYDEADPIGAYVQKGEVAAEAIRANGIPRVVFLSSVGAELRRGAGLIDGLGQTEELLDATDAHLVHLRPGFFFTNFLQQVEAIRDMGAFFGAAPEDVRMPYLDPRDIGEIAAARLLNPAWTGRTVQAIHGPATLTFAETAEVLSDVLGRKIRYVEVSDEDFRGALLAKGVSESTADGYVQMYRGLRTFTPENPRSIVTTTPTTLGQWAFELLRPIVGTPVPVAV